MAAESNRVSVQQAAAELGLSVQGVREYMKRGLIDIGAVLPAINNDGKTYRYLIFRDKLDKQLGKIKDAQETRDNGQAAT